MESILIEYVAHAIYAVCAFIVGYLWRSRKAAEKEDEEFRLEQRLIKKAVCALVRDKIIHKYEKCMVGGYCSVEYLTDVEELYKVYRELGGNGIMKELMEKIRRLPTTPPDENVERKL